MKLIGSEIENKYRKDLLKGSNFLLNESGDPKLLGILQKKIGDIYSAYYLNGYEVGDYHTCSLLINGDSIFHIEYSGEHLEEFYEISIPEYRNGLKKKDQIKLLVALDLSLGELSNVSSFDE